VYRERLTAPLSWWVVVVAFGLVCGWIMLVATTTVIAIAATLVGTALAGGLVWAYGSALLIAGPEGLRVGPAHLTSDAIGTVTSLDARAMREQLGPHADARAWMRTRPYIDTGVRVEVADAADPTPYWLVSSRRPEAVAAALSQTGVGQTGPARTNGEVHGGQEEEV
jgi:hypothetical protein